jgi:hypothetical protein
MSIILKLTFFSLVFNTFILGLLFYLKYTYFFFRILELQNLISRLEEESSILRDSLDSSCLFLIRDSSLILFTGENISPVSGVFGFLFFLYGLYVLFVGCTEIADIYERLTTLSCKIIELENALVSLKFQESNSFILDLTRELGEVAYFSFIFC